MNDCADYDEEHCGPCPEYGGTKEVGCYKPINKKTESVAKLQCSDGLCNLLREALAIVDGKGRAIPGGSYAVWKGDWQDLRDTIFKAYEVVNKEVA